MGPEANPGSTFPVTQATTIYPPLTSQKTLPRAVHNDASDQDRLGPYTEQFQNIPSHPTSLILVSVLPCNFNTTLWSDPLLNVYLLLPKQVKHNKHCSLTTNSLSPSLACSLAHSFIPSGTHSLAHVFNLCVHPSYIHPLTLTLHYFLTPTFTP